MFLLLLVFLIVGTSFCCIILLLLISSNCKNCIEWNPAREKNALNAKSERKEKRWRITSSFDVWKKFVLIAYCVNCHIWCVCVCIRKINTKNIGISCCCVILYNLTNSDEFKMVVKSPKEIYEYKMFYIRVKFISHTARAHIMASQASILPKTIWFSGVGDFF